MEERDFPAVEKVANDSWAFTYEGIIPKKVQQMFLSKAYSAVMLKVRMERSHFYVAELDGKIVGFANFSTLKEGGIVELAAIYLLPDVQGQGIGTKLLEHGIKQLENVKEVHLSVEKENRIGRSFYEAKGFEVYDEYEEAIFDVIVHTVRMKLVVS